MNRISIPKWAERNEGTLGKACYATDLGASFVGKSEEIIQSPAFDSLRGKVQLIFTSPPFPLNRKKRYDNKQGDAYKEWLRAYAEPLRDLLTPDGSIVMEVGNAWTPGLPTMDTLAIEALLDFKKEGAFHLCQEFVWCNPAKLPTPAQWVTIERIRVKDAFTRLWWLSSTAHPKADNRRVLVPYSKSMQKLLRTQKYNAGRRPSEHDISATSFLANNGGAIPPNVIVADEERVPPNYLMGSNTHNGGEYEKYCRDNNLTMHPARMPMELPRFFINLCTTPGDIVLDPFAGSNTTGAAAQALGRKWVSVEAQQAYAEAGRGRFAQGAQSDSSRQLSVVKHG